MIKTIRKYLFFLSLGLLCFPGHSQIKDIGLPSIKNYPRNIYNASTQNWSATQSTRGFMYFGNNDGILEYNGTGWNIYPMPNQSIVRSVMAAGDTIFAGAFEEIGFLAPNEKGQLAWNSLNHLIPPEYSGFDEIWNIFRNDESIIFQSFSYVFIYLDGKIEVIKPKDEFGFMHNVDGKLHIVDRERGLMLLEENNLALVSDHKVFLQNEITFIFPHLNNSLLIGTSNEGLFVLRNGKVKPWESPTNQYLKKYNTYSGQKLSDGHIAIGTISNGLFITDPDGNPVQHLNRTKGLQNNTVLALFEDKRNNLWMALDNGIDFIEISSPLSFLNHNYNIESVYATKEHNGILYVGTNQGLFGIRVENLSNRQSLSPDFRLINGTEGQVWSLRVLDNTLLCGHNQGSFQIDGFNARQISDIRGFWSFLKLPHHQNLAIAGTFSGLARLEKKENNWYFLDEIKGFSESSRNLFLDQNNQLWVSHGYKGLFRLDVSDDFSEVTNIRFYRGEAGLPQELPYNIQEIHGKMFITTQDGILTFNHQDDAFVADPGMNELFKNKDFIDKIYQDNYGNLWYYTYEYIGLMRRLEDGTFRDILSPFSGINNYLLPAFQNIFLKDFNNVFIGSQKGLIHYDPFFINDYQSTEQVFLQEISFYGKQESQAFYSYSEEVLNNREGLLQMPFGLNSVVFRYTTPVYENPEAITFSYKLRGFDNDWSEWESLNFKEYTNLREGEYTFMVKAKNPFGTESEISSFHFSVSPPIYRSKVAFVFYFLLFALIVSGNVYYVRKRMLKIRQREKIRHEKRLARKEQIFKEQTALSEKEIMELRNESLANEMQHKNKELANATMHLIQKNNALTALKSDLNKMLKNIPEDNPEKQNIQNLIRKVNKELRSEKHWELFDSYFDEVHQDFINRLKEKYDNLSPKELRLCAYLRMNLSTKEIAPLMNISIRGVEISRYRLRKKLNLDHEVNLTEFFMTF